MGCYYLTMSVPEAQGRRHDLLARWTKWRWPTPPARSHTHAKIKVRLPKDRCMREDDGSKKPATARSIDTTVGRVMFNMILPQGHAVLQHRRCGRASWPA